MPPTVRTTEYEAAVQPEAEEIHPTSFVPLQTSRISYLHGEAKSYNPRRQSQAGPCFSGPGDTAAQAMRINRVYASTAGVARHFRTLPELLAISPEMRHLWHGEEALEPSDQGPVVAGTY